MRGSPLRPFRPRAPPAGTKRPAHIHSSLALLTEGISNASALELGRSFLLLVENLQLSRRLDAALLDGSLVPANRLGRVGLDGNRADAVDVGHRERDSRPCAQFS